MIELQQALKDKGFDPGPVDGIAGRRTIAAITAFQTANGLPADGVAGPATLAKLAGPAAAVPPAHALDNLSMPWLQEAMRNRGLREGPGSGTDNPTIMDWSKRLRINYAKDEISWCGLFVAHCVGLTLPTEPLPSNPLSARAYQKFGVPCPVPQPGAIMVFWRVARTDWRGHVGFYVGEDANGFHILGGNQGDAVTIARFPRDRFLEARWPRTAPAPVGKPRILAPNGRFSETEQ
ncbi:TIGR02594 family protein [Sandarakinorhabdus sp.]|uniref:NlpC/P60 family protein n=1 Tax=Sandarakinorhabdus sp. TaxID=1916663 RepID=UPI00286E2136|nr:TIGR02594 family protein [Sandarakinorhabdus sp.]